MTEFDESKSFDENLAEFLLEMESAYIGLGPILRNAIPQLLSANDEASRRLARTRFNRIVQGELDAMALDGDETQ